MLSTVLAASPVDPKSLLETFGVLGLFGIVFAETGLMVGFFLPGDSLLVLAGLVAAVGAESKLDVDINLGRRPRRPVHRRRRSAPRPATSSA